MPAIFTIISVLFACKYILMAASKLYGRIIEFVKSDGEK